MPRELTKKEARVLGFIEHYSNLKGKAPTYQEISDYLHGGLGWNCSKTMAWLYVQKLVVKGRVRHVRGKRTRAIKIVR
jgi:hypothetical protein